MDIIHKNLSEVPHLYEQTIELIENSLGYTSEHSFKDDFYPLINESNLSNMHILLLDDEPIAHIGFLKRTLSHSSLKTNAYLIGGVVVKEEHQGKGLITELLTKLIEQYNDECSLFCMWSNLTDLYNKFHFYEVGTLMQLGQDPLEQTTDYIKSKYENLSNNEKKQIKSLYESQYKDLLTIKRTNDNWKDIEHIKSADLFIKASGEKIHSYFFYNKGMDLNGIIYEIGSLKLEEDIKSLENNRLWLPFNQSSQREPHCYLYQGFFRIGNHDKFKDFIADWSKKKIMIKEIGNDIHFEFESDLYTIDQSIFLRSLWGPEKIQEFEGLGPDIFISGIDSV